MNNCNSWLIVWSLLHLAMAKSPVVKQLQHPQFDRPSENVTVTIGSLALLPCFINNLGDHKVAWIKVANNDILAIGDYKVTNDDRIKLMHSYISDWSLSIQPVSEEDQGEYICQINTEPQSITRIVLQVLLPPKIIEEKSSIIPESVLQGQTLKLYCHADGIPTPKISWYFRRHQDSRTVVLKDQESDALLLTAKPLRSNFHLIQEGNTLTIRNISTHHSGVFECIANNSVPPAASRKIRVNVEFPPVIELESETVEQLVGLDARFECRIRANPLTNHYWMKDDQVIDNTIANPYNFQSNLKREWPSFNHNKYEINIYNLNGNDFMKISALVVKKLTKDDFGIYQCYAVNEYNTTRAEVELKELIVRRPTTTKNTASRILFYSNNHHKLDENSNEYRLTTRQVLNLNKKQQNQTNGGAAQQGDTKLRLSQNQDSFTLFTNESISMHRTVSSFMIILVYLAVKNLEIY